MTAFEWPQFKNEKERIKHYSALYKNQSITDAFDSVYKTKTVVLSPEIPKDYVVGDVIKLKITSITKGDAHVESNSFKIPVRIKDNLSKWKAPLPFEVDGKVVQIKPNELVVDVMGHQVQSAIPNILKTLDNQKKIDGFTKYIVKNLKLTRGGFLGDLVLPELDIMEGYTVPAFIPGSQIVLNKTDNFEKHVGTDVIVHISSLSPHGNVICSCKEYLQHLGNLNLIKIFNAWCDQEQEWKDISSKVYKGRVTGIVNNAHKRGVYVEIPEENLTAMISHEHPEQYEAGMIVNVSITDIQEQTTFNKDAQQRQRVEPFVIEDGILKSITIKPVFSFV